MIIIVAGKTVKGPVLVDVKNNEEAEPCLPTQRQRSDP